ncbi:MAG: 2-oxoacid:acceptor oxidoreductase family protein [Candidatus Omnitrophica bacterium]|nr:2-oxoacid:acceptor oxidoreductase family protein [Candidatus Omnitrophota bacterium]MBL7150992.1 2-oxoacid:acceptor oxidoreductase family protein [Candidatus Omnitrophota bacterium]MBL7210178.1 2-oxoacid:acceptor oxidoreductase family protein [Candidatus Omnitrophota bacterium]
MTERIIIAGAGGQGIMLLGKVLSMAAMRKGKFVTWLPSYGAEVRGGTAHCMVVISDQEIGSPYIDKADTLIVMNKPSLTRFQSKIKDKGLVLINSSLIDKYPRGNSRLLPCPFSELAMKLGNIKVANMVALGAFLSQRKIVDLKDIFGVISDIAPEDKRGLIEVNKRALEEGAKYGSR